MHADYYFSRPMCHSNNLQQHNFLSIGKVCKTSSMNHHFVCPFWKIQGLQPLGDRTKLAHKGRFPDLLLACRQINLIWSLLAQPCKWMFIILAAQEGQNFILGTFSCRRNTSAESSNNNWVVNKLRDQSQKRSFSSFYPFSFFLLLSRIYLLSLYLYHLFSFLFFYRT